MRPGIIKAVHNHMKKNKDSYFLTGDLGFSVLEELQKEFPTRVINMGVAEQNMIGVASGLALSGKKVFVYSIVPFVTMRCYEQIRNDICYHNLDVMIIGLGGGLSYGVLSATHFALEDFAIMRPLPHMNIFSPSDEMEAVLGMEALLNRQGPVYVRVGKKSEPTVYEKPFSFTFGKANIYSESKRDNIVIFATGPILSEVVKAIPLLEKQGIMPTVVDVHTVKPIDAKLIERISAGKTLAVSVEEHYRIGGFGSAVAEVLSQVVGSPRLLIIGTDDRFIKELGNHDYLRETFGLSASGLTDQIVKAFKKE